MRKRWPAALLVLLLGACMDQSNVDPDASVTIVGSFARQDGSPAREVPVSLYREADVGEGLAAFASAGLVCLADDRKLATCSHGDDTETDANGRFEYRMQGRDTHGFLGNAATLELTGALPRGRDQIGGSATTVRFQVQTESLTFPLRFWEPDVRATTDGGLVRVEWPLVPPQIAPPQIDTSRLAYHLVFERPGGEPVWSVAAVQDSTVFDERVLEDSSGALAISVTGRGMRVPDSLGREVDLIVRSGRFPYRGTAGAPPSRGASCSIPGPDGSPVQQSPCPLTDGNFWTRMTPACPAGATPCTAARNEITIDLGDTKSATFIVVRGCDDRCTVQTSVPGEPFRVVGVTQSDAGYVAMSNPGGRARYVRVSGQASITDLTEVSIWPDRTQSGPPRSILADTSGLLPPVQRALERGRSLPIAIAALLVALIGGMLAGAALRRRSA